MRIELLYFDGCPNWEVAARRLEAVAHRRGLTVQHRLITTADEAEEARFRGSPTILVDGHDPFGGADEAFGLTCRLYLTPDGLDGAPTEEQLETVLGLAGSDHGPL